MRIPLRFLGIAALAVIGATCSDAPSRPARFSTKGRLAIAPVFTSDAAAVFARRDQFAAVTFDHVRVMLARGAGSASGEKVRDTTIVFTPGSSSVTIDLTVDVAQVGDPFDATVEYTANGVAVFRGTQTVQSYAFDAPTPNATEISVAYVGVGASAKTVAIAGTQRNLNVQHPAVTTFSATVTDQNGNQMGEVPVAWTSSNTAVATIVSSTGVLSTVGRGTTTITVQTPTAVTDNTTLTVGLPATKFDLRSGNGQTGRAGGALSPITIRALATDNLPVAGVAVSITAPAGGNATPANGATDANGDFTFIPTLGGTVGTQNFVANSVLSSGTSLSLTIPATATAGLAASIQPISGSNQADTIRFGLKQPFVAKVVDQFGNGVPGIAVGWARTAGSGSLGAATSTTNSNGDAVMTYTLGSTAGGEQVTASASGVSNGATFTATALPAGPADITIVSGNTQTGKALLPLEKTFVAVVVDRAGATVVGATVTWAATNGSFESATTISDAQGQVRNTLKLAGKLGAASATASIPNGKLITFGATVRPGIPTHLAYRTQPSNAVAGVAISPAIEVELRDGAENVATDDDANVALAISSNPGAATLSGTSTRKSVNGVATFDNISLDKAANGYGLVAISGTLPQLVSAAFNISPAGPAKISIVAGSGQTATVNTAVATPPSVRVADAFDNPVPGRGVHFAPSTGSGTANPDDVNTTADGIATLTSWVLGTAIGPKSMVVSIPSAASVPTVTFTATAIAGQATTLAITTQPSTSAVAGTPLAVQPVIQLQDTYGNPTAVGAPTTITATASSGPGTATGNVATAVAGSGSATFNGLTLTSRATVTLTFAAAPLNSVVSNSVAVSAGAPQSIALACTDNQTATVNTPVATPPCVRVTDVNGNLVPNAAVVFAPTAGTVSPSGTVNTDAQGLAGVGQWTLGTAAGAQAVDVSMRDFPSVAHVTFHATAIAGQAFKLAIVRQPSPTSIAGIPSSIQPIVQMQDQFGNPTGLGAPASGIVATPSAGGTSGNTATPNSAGTASYTSLVLQRAGSLTISFGGGTLQPVTSAAVAVAPSEPAALTIVAGEGQLGTVHQPLATALSVRITDFFGNVVPGVGALFTPNAGSVPPPNQRNTDATGTASLSWTLGDVAGAQSLSVTVPGFGFIPAVTFHATARAGPLSRYVVTSNPVSPAVGMTSVISARGVDAFNNTVTSLSTVQWSNSGQGSISPASSPTDGAGVASATYSAPAVSNSEVVTATAAGVPTITGSVTVATAPTAAPTIAFQSFTQSVNDPGCSNGGSLFAWTFSYSDPDGNINTNSVTLTFTFDNSAPQTAPWGGSRNGTAFAGTMTLTACILYNAANSVVESWFLTDAGGLSSNTASVTFARPPGANSIDRRSPSGSGAARQYAPQKDTPAAGSASPARRP